MTHDYYELLRHYCDLNQIPYHESWDGVVGYMIEHPTSIIEYYTPYARLFKTLYQLITHSIELADFVNYADITKPMKIIEDNDHIIEADCIVCDVLFHSSYDVSKYTVITLY